MSYGVAYSLLSGHIYVGRLNPSGVTWDSKEEHSIPAVLAAAEWVLRQHNGEVYLTPNSDGPAYHITVEKIEDES